MLSFSRASSTTSPADALCGSGPLRAHEGAGDVAAGRIDRSARPLPVAGAGALTRRRNAPSVAQRRAGSSTAT